MLDLVIMPPSPNKKPSKGRKPEAQQSNRRLSIKDYFSTVEPTSPTPASRSKKRKAEADAPATPSQAKKLASNGVTGNVAGSSDKENGQSNAPSIEGDICIDICITPEQPITQTKVKADKAKQKGKEKAYMDDEDTALEAQLAGEADVAPKFQPINITSAAMALQAIHSVKSDKEGFTLSGSRPKALQPSVEPTRTAKIKVPKGRKEPAEKVSKTSKEPKKPGSSKDKVAKKPKEQKGMNLKIATNTSKGKKKVPEIWEPTGEKKKLVGETKDKTEIREWKQYEPKNPVSSSTSIAANSIIKHLQTMGPIRAPPKLERPPEFEHIEISYPLLVIHDRLIVREFFLRFEKCLRIVTKHIHIVNNPNSEWTDLTYRSVILCILRVLQTDDKSEIHWGLLSEGIKEIEKTPPDDTKLWTILCSILDGHIDPANYTDFSQHRPRLSLIIVLITLAMGTSMIRDRIEKDQANLKAEEKQTVEQIRSIKADWDVTKQEFSKLRLTVVPEEKAKLEATYREERAFMLNKISLLESRSWFKKRKLQLRQRPLGTDAKGNTYWLFIQREKRAEDWGSWIVIERAPELPHPSGSIPPNLLLIPEPCPGESDPSHPEASTESEIKKRVWYAISTSAEAFSLANWIKGTAEMILYEKATKSTVEAAASLGNSSPMRQRLQAVEVPMSPSMQKMVDRNPKEAKRLGFVVSREKVDPKGIITKERVEELCKTIRMVGKYWELEETKEVVK